MHEGGGRHFIILKLLCYFEKFNAWMVFKHCVCMCVCGGCGCRWACVEEGVCGVWGVDVGFFNVWNIIFFFISGIICRNPIFGAFLAHFKFWPLFYCSHFKKCIVNQICKALFYIYKKKNNFGYISSQVLQTVESKFWLLLHLLYSLILLKN